MPESDPTRRFAPLLVALASSVPGVVLWAWLCNGTWGAAVTLFLAATTGVFVHHAESAAPRVAWAAVGAFWLSRLYVRGPEGLRTFDALSTLPEGRFVLTGLTLVAGFALMAMLMG